MICIKRAMRGFVAPKDVFRNPEAFYRFFVKTEEHSPFELTLQNEGDEFAVMNTHFKMGSYDIESASAIEALLSIIHKTKFPCLIPSS